MAKLVSPVRSPLIRTGKFGNRPPVPIGGGKFADRNHRGVDIRAAVGTPVYPVESGEVVQVRTGWRSRSSPGTIRGSRIFSDPGAGNLVVVRGRSGDIIYCHLNTVHVAVGTRVSTQTLVARSGVTGVTQPHLHVGIWKRVIVAGRTKWVPIDPTPMMPWDGDKFGELKIGQPEKPAPKPVPKPPVKTPEQIEEEELMSAVQELKNYIDQAISEESSRRRADVRGFIHLDLGEDGNLPPEKARHAVLIAPEGILVLQPPAKYGMGQINSIVSGTASNRTDYRWVDPKRWDSPLRTGKFINRVKDSLTMRNYFGDDRQVTVDEAWAWIRRHETIKASQVS